MGFLGLDDSDVMTNGRNANIGTHSGDRQHVRRQGSTRPRDELAQRTAECTRLLQWTTIAGCIPFAQLSGPNKIHSPPVI